MEERIQELLHLIHYDFIDMNSRTLMIQDMDLDRSIIMDVPGKLLSDDQTRSIECKMSKEQQWLQVRNSNIDENMPFFRASTEISDQGDNYYSYEVEKDGSLFDTSIGTIHNHNVCHLRKMDLLENKPFVVDVCYQDKDLMITRSYQGNVEKVALHSMGDDSGVITFSKNGEDLESVSVSGDLKKYYSSLISIVSDTVFQGNELLYELSPALFYQIRDTFPQLKEIISYQKESYETDYIDEYLRKYNLFTNSDSIYSVK